MANLSSLATRFYNRVGITTASAIAASQVKEAINAGAARAASDGVPGLASNYFVGSTEGSTSLTVSSHSAGTSTITFSSVSADTRPGDVCDIDGVRYLVYSVNSDANSIDFGSPIHSSKVGATVTLYQRTVQLPTAGRVLEVLELGNLIKLVPTPDGVTTYGLTSYTDVGGYEQLYDGTNAYLVIWPVLDTAKNFAVKQLKSLSTMGDSDTLSWPDETLDAVLSRAVHIWRSWKTGGVSPVEASLSKEDIKDSSSGKQVSRPAQVHIRKNGTRR
jgi:hypothetical protein